MANISLATSLADVEANMVFETLPIGTYEVEVEQIEVKQANGKEFPYLSMRYNIIEPTEFAGKKLFDNVSMAPTALFKLKQLTLACNLDIGAEFDTDDLLGANVSVVVKHENKKDNAGNLVMLEDGVLAKRETIDRYIFE